MRLIDANNYCKNICRCNDKRCNKEKCPILTAPTAYNVEKVVEKLNDLRMKEYDDSDEEPEFTDVDDWYDEGVSHGKFTAYKNAIDIVRKGGVNYE